jgi:5-methylcytosine-specific restriction endonuclease McrA
MLQNSSGRLGAKRHDEAKKSMGKSPDHKARQREHDAKRGSARERGYNTRWEEVRKTYVMRNLLCVMCAKENQVTAPTVVNHITSHKATPLCSGTPRIAGSPSASLTATGTSRGTSKVGFRRRVKMDAPSAKLSASRSPR